MNQQKYIKRESILSNIDYNKERNLFCQKKVLSNEASVESFFIDRLIKNLGYTDNQIKTKKSLSELNTAKGSKKYNYKPDYAIIKNQLTVLIIDAKATNVKITDYIEQCAHYCLLLNRQKETVKYFLLSNGFKTALYKWNKEKPIIELNFQDFYNGNKKYEELRKLISNKSINEESKKAVEFIELQKINKEAARKLFLACHKYIWNTEKRGPLSAFTEFIKLIFVKLLNDKILHEDYTMIDKTIKVPVFANIFSVKWIESREKEISNPINNISFKNLLNIIQDDIDKNNKKTIFDINEEINLKPTTIKGVAKKLERIDLFGIDEDLNGRLFETFLNATMRGKALGQYFTPRSIVLLGTYLANLQISDKHIDKVIDASCGSGGFLIEALAIMRNKVRTNNFYSKEKKEKLINDLCSNYLFGIDAATDPNLAKIARINMYLHGDGGSHIYFYDGLEKDPVIDKNDSRLIQKETTDLINNIKNEAFDVILTNPPFSMWYEETNELQNKILEKYELINFDIKKTNKTRNRLRGSAMFIERYRDLLKPGGKLISIIDETVLSSNQYDYVRNFIRNNFIIRAIISLHGDAFQMAKARVKTALIYLQKKEYKNEEQPPVFMYSSIYLGVDDLPMTTNPIKVIEARLNAKKEIKEIVNAFKRFENGETGQWLVPPERVTNRLDVKSCVPLFGRFVDSWKKKGFEVKKLVSLITLREEIIKPKAEYPNEKFKILTITYSGKCKTEEIRYGKDINYSKMKIVRDGDLVFSEYNTFHGAIGYITKKFDGALASGSYTVTRCKNKIESLYLWSILRTTEIRADFLTSAIGMGRQTISWENIKNVQIPYYSYKKRKELAEKILNAWKIEEKAKNNIKMVFKNLHKDFNVESEKSKTRFIATKPPK